MGDFLAFRWRASNPAASSAAVQLSIAAEAAGWRAAADPQAGLAILTRGGRAPPVRALDDGQWLIGDCLGAGRTSPVAADVIADASTTLQAATALSLGAWGRYVALLADHEGTAVFRDPSGALDCVAWVRDDVQVVTSAAEVPAALLPARLGLDWDVIAGWLVDPGLMGATYGLDGLTGVTPGSLATFEDGSVHQVLVWNPAEHVRRRTSDGAALDRDLQAVVDLSVRGLVAPYRRLVGEISGGLDSAVVAASLVDAGLGDRVPTWINYFGDRPEGDERDYARAVAHRLGVTLRCVEKLPHALTETDFAEMARGLRPAIGALDVAYDRDAAARLNVMSADGLLSGQGGDVVFFQMPSPLLLVDEVGRVGLRALTIGRIGDVARLSRRSAWSVLATVRRHARRRTAEPFRTMGLNPAKRGGTAAAQGAWAMAAEGLPPAKQLQVMALSQAQLYLGDCRRRRTADLIYPLLSQPVMEHCLSLSIQQLTEGRRDRALARRAFAERLPALVTGRRSKGDLTAHYGRTVALSLDVLRPLLLDGCLCEAGLLDRAHLESTLTPERLIHGARNGEILIAATIESWVRWWQTRIPDSPAAPRSRA